MYAIVKLLFWYLLTQAVVVCLLQVLFQFGYTTIFGWYATHIFLSTGHLAGAVAVHTFCNWMGFPAIGEVMHHPQRNMLLAAYIGGITMFFMMLKPLTDPLQYHMKGPGVMDLLLGLL